MVSIHKLCISLGFVACALYIFYEVYGCAAVPNYEYFKMAPFLIKSLTSDAQDTLIKIQYFSRNCALIFTYFCIYKSVKLHNSKLIWGFVCYLFAEIIRNGLYASACEDTRQEMSVISSFGQILFPILFFIFYAIAYSLIGGYLVNHKATKRSGAIIIFLSIVQIFGGPIVPFANYTVSDYRGISDRIPIYTQLIFMLTITYEFVFNKYLEIDRKVPKKIQ